LFTKEIQRALLENEIDFAVHSLKDLPTEKVQGLTLAAVPLREANSDAFVCSIANCLEELPPNARVGTGSLRRKAQLLHFRDDLQVLDIRGNLDTRLRKLDEGKYDAIILAEAGLRRLELQDRISQVLPREVMLPAVGQGALGVETRQDDADVLRLLDPINDATSRQAVLAERAMLAALRGGCLAPVGGWARLEGLQLRLEGVVLSGDGRQRIHAEQYGDPAEADGIGRAVAEILLQKGAAELIATSRAS